MILHQSRVMENSYDLNIKKIIGTDLSCNLRRPNFKLDPEKKIICGDKASCNFCLVLFSFIAIFVFVFFCGRYSLLPFFLVVFFFAILFSFFLVFCFPFFLVFCFPFFLVFFLVSYFHFFLVFCSLFLIFALISPGSLNYLVQTWKFQSTKTIYLHGSYSLSL